FDGIGGCREIAHDEPAARPAHPAHLGEHRGGLLEWWNAKRDTTTEKAPASHGRCVTSPLRKGGGLVDAPGRGAGRGAGQFALSNPLSPSRTGARSASVSGWAGPTAGRTRIRPGGDLAPVVS